MRYSNPLYTPATSECEDPDHEGNRLVGDTEYACVQCLEIAEDDAADAAFEAFRERALWDD